MTLPDMLARWGFHQNASLLLALAPGHPEDYRISNFGFGIARRTPVALEALQRTLDCPNSGVWVASRPSCT